MPVTLTNGSSGIAFFSRSSTGSTPSSRAMSSMNSSRATCPGVQPTPRYAPTGHLFVSGASTSVAMASML
jgi:hypothetical protein